MAMINNPLKRLAPVLAATMPPMRRITPMMKTRPMRLPTLRPKRAPITDGGRRPPSGGAREIGDPRHQDEPATMIA